MSVPKDKRGEGRLEVNTTARGLCQYVLRITANRKKFPEEHMDLISRFRDLAVSIDLKCWRANNVLSNNEKRYKNRLELQEDAAQECTDIIELVNILKPVIHMSGKRYSYLSEQYAGLRKKIRNWNYSDRKRLNPQ